MWKFCDVKPQQLALLAVFSFFSVDASNSDRLARFINDAPRQEANCHAKTVFLVDKPRVLIFANKDIQVNEELRYDYGVTDAPWRKVRPI